MPLDFHEPPEELTARTRELHRGLATLIEELEAVDWYQHRIDVTGDESLKGIMVHNRNEELEHAAMTIEWLRRRIPDFDEQLRTYLFTEVPILEAEEAAEADGDGEEHARPSGKSLGIGSLRNR
jgi:hypothetical protein